MICPICNNISELNVCPVCGYDESCDHEAYPTLIENSSSVSTRSNLLHTYAMALRERCGMLEARIQVLENSTGRIITSLKLANENITALSERLEKLNVEQMAYAIEKVYAHPDNIIDTPMAFSALKLGDVLTIGKYQQLDIEWIVLDTDNKKALLISKYVLDSRVFSNSRNYRKGNLWEGSALREWLNGTFYRTVFTKSEQSRIASIRLPDNDVTDKIFLLSTYEYKKYFRADSSGTYSADAFSGKCSPTSYALKIGTYTDNLGNSMWWLRSAGTVGDTAVCVNSRGNLVEAGHTTSRYSHGVRPAMYIKL